MPLSNGGTRTKRAPPLPRGRERVCLELSERRPIEAQQAGGQNGFTQTGVRTAGIHFFSALQTIVLQALAAVHFVEQSCPR